MTVSREFDEWADGWHASETDWTRYHVHRPDPGWSTARLRGYEAEAEHRGDWPIIREVPVAERSRQ